MDPPSVLNVHTPSSSFAIIHSLTQETLFDLYNKLSRKASTDYYGARVGPGWLKYEYNEAIWNLDDDSDYGIFVWRHRQQEPQQDEPMGIEAVPQTPVASSSRMQLPTWPSVAPPPPAAGAMHAAPTLHLHNPATPLPAPPAYRNPAYYTFQPARAAELSPTRRSPAPSHASTGRRSKKGKGTDDERAEDAVPKFKKQFDRFHSENGVRTVMGQIGPVHNVRMLLKAGYRHVYIARKFAIKHGFIPPDAAPGNYGYGGLVSIGSWPITLTPSSTQPGRPAPGYQHPDAFRKPGHAASPPQSAYSSPRAPGAALPPQAPGFLAAPNANGKTRSIRSVDNTVTHNGVSGKRRPSHGAAGQDNPPKHGRGTEVMVEVYLSEEPHFDVVLGRSFIEKRQIRMHSIDPTDVVCLDTGEKIECELVILKDGRGEIVTVT